MLRSCVTVKDRLVGGNRIGNVNCVDEEVAVESSERKDALRDGRGNAKAFGRRFLIGHLRGSNVGQRFRELTLTKEIPHDRILALPLSFSPSAWPTYRVP